MNTKDTLMWKELSEGPAAVGRVGRENEAVLERLAAVGSGIEAVCTVGRGTSDHAMMYLKYLLEAGPGILTASAAPSTVTLYGGRPKLQKALTVGCSQSGEAADVMEVLRAAKACGGLTAAVTNEPESPMAGMADFALSCCAGKEKSVAATKTFLGQLALARLICAALSGAKEDLTALSGALTEALPRIEAAAEPMAERFAGIRECFILSRGISAAVAFECGLKLQETCYIRARAYHSSDFYHGPMAMVEEKTPVILFASSRALGGETEAAHRKDLEACADKMLSLGAELWVITDQPALFAGKGARTVAVPGGADERDAVFFFALAAQMLACKVSCRKGLSPDTPRALKKVTVTR